MQHAQRLSYALARVCSTAVEYHQSTTSVLDRQVSTHMKVRTWPGVPAKPSSPGLSARPVGTQRVLTGYSHGGAHLAGRSRQAVEPGLARTAAPAERAVGTGPPVVAVRAVLPCAFPLSAAIPTYGSGTRTATRFPLTAALALPPDPHLRPIRGLPPLGSRSPHAVLGVLTLGYYRQKRAAGEGRGGVVGAFRSGR